ncbi:ATP-dependent helicase HrpB [Sanguibacter sp. A247]|uniref:ATP-dependent helicase HrpB n=1 Tax=unclassified Sanguibacter TaxID=2645534 RepID=UPI003FD8CF00
MVPVTDPIARLLAAPPDLPVAQHLGEVRARLAQAGVLVVAAPPGTGKTTLVPPALAADVTGRVLVTQPRRVAARAAARRLAELCGDEVGGIVGHAVRGDVRRSARTRIEVATAGLVLRRVQSDPGLDGVDVVVLDEVHERHLDADLLLALLLEVRRTLRPELRIVVMSATIDIDALADLIGDDAPAPIVNIAAETHPVTMHWAPPPARVARLDERGPTRGFLDHVAATTRAALADAPGDVLVIVPGAREVDTIARALDGARDASGGTVDVRRLHGRLPGSEQDLALREGPRRRIVVATAVAESSLTVPGVRTVVDAGLAREPRTDHVRGLAGLVTVSVSRAGADQRAGRAGRLGPGTAWRCWAENDHPRLRPFAEPEIRTADLAAFVLSAACWGGSPADLALLDAPPPAALASARATLHALGALDDDGHVTPRGRRIDALGTDPRLARALLDGADAVGARRAAEIVALLDSAPSAPGADLVAAWRRIRQGGPGSEDWRRQSRRLADRLGAAGAPEHRLGDDAAAGLVVALAHPERIARRRPGGRGYLMASGTGAALPAGSALAGAQWLAIADADRGPGRSDALVRAAAPLDEDSALDAAGGLLHEETSLERRDGHLLALRRTQLGAITLVEERLPRPDRATVAAAVRDGLRRDGLPPLSESASRLRARLALVHRTLGEPWPDVSDEALLGRLEDWLGPDLGDLRTPADFTRRDSAALRRLLPWPEAARLDELVPERLSLPAGTSAAVDYAGDVPVLAAKVQEVFGWDVTPRLVDGRVPVVLHLLSPARRPTAVTSDLASFWQQGYPQVRAELRGRYPKHDWPHDPTTAVASRGVRRR